MKERVTIQIVEAGAVSRNAQAEAAAAAARKVPGVVAVPLFVSSRSEVIDQTQYVLGLRDKPSETLKRAMAALPGWGK